MKALKNFSCNGIKKKSGESISPEEMKQMGQAGKDMQFADLISQSEVEKPVMPIAPVKPKASKKKVSKKS